MDYRSTWSGLWSRGSGSRVPDQMLLGTTSLRQLKKQRNEHDYKVLSIASLK
jgi:hypothetical protein